ncbi:MAG: sulfatase [Candidatus Bathyarchaeota archaeon]|nr:sulfatase [Candidatus Bathyarchaeota archaeon]
MKNLLLFISFLCAAIILNGCSNLQKEEKKPNVIVFLVDDLGWNDTSLDLTGESTKYNERYQTPNLEKLASQGITFTHARTNAICVPSRVSLLTGQNFMRHQVKGDLHTMFNTKKTLEFPGGKAIAEPHNMLPAVLKRHGYYTVHAGKYHACHRCPAEKSPTPEAAGFDVNIGGTGFGAPANYYAIDSFQRRNATQKQPMPGLEKYFGKDMHLTEALTIESLNAVKGAVDKDQPFFLYLAHYAVHTPIQEHKPYRQNYTLIEGEPENEAAYASMIEGVDVSLGTVMKALDDMKIADNTLLIFYSDNGGRVLWRGKKSLYENYEFNYPLRSGKASAYEGGIRVPCVVRWPGKTKSQARSSAPLMIEDIYSTVLNAAGISTANNYPMDGKDWSVFLGGQETPVDFKNRSLFFFMPYRFDGVEYNGPDFAHGGVAASASIIKNEWKLLYFFEKEIFELYNLNEDIGEKHNLIDENPEKANELIEELDRNMHEKNITTVPLLLPERIEAKWPLKAWRGNNSTTRQQ